jgi:hypothetical protein
MKKYAERKTGGQLSLTPISMKGALDTNSNARN